MKSIAFFLKSMMIVIAFFAGCDRPQKLVENSDSSAVKTVASAELQTGVYLISRWTVDEGALEPLFDNELFVEYREEEFHELADEEPEPTKYIALAGSEYIPLELQTAPERKEGLDGRSEVSLTFTKEMVGELTAFSRKYLGRQVALVIDGDVVTIHKIKSVLTGTGLKISRCTDNGCDLILAKLKE